MKKIIALILAGVLAAGMLISCGEKFFCFNCETEKTGKKYEYEIAGEKITMCKDCYNRLSDAINEFEKSIG